MCWRLWRRLRGAQCECLVRTWRALVVASYDIWRLFYVEQCGAGWRQRVTVTSCAASQALGERANRCVCVCAAQVNLERIAASGSLSDAAMTDNAPPGTHNNGTIGPRAANMHRICMRANERGAGSGRPAAEVEPVGAKAPLARRSAQQLGRRLAISAQRRTVRPSPACSAASSRAG